MEEELASSLARRLGLAFDGCAILDRGMNVVVHLRPTSVVARVTRLAHLVRPIDAFAGGVALAKHLGAQRALSPTTLIDPGPHLDAGRYVTFWTHHTRVAAAPAEAGGALRELHDSAASFRGRLRSFDPRPDALRVADIVGGEHGAILRETALRLALPSVPTQAIHGDAHFENCLAGGIWQDFDEVCVGPREWDVASMTHRWVVFGELEREMRDALIGYGSYDTRTVEALQPLVVLAIATWGVLARLINAWSPRTELRLEWLRRH